jgi:hypothetical protein
MVDEERREPGEPEIRVEPVEHRVEAPEPAESGVPVVPPAGSADDADAETDAEAEARFDEERQTRNPGAIRAEDTEPYLALQYVARLFKIAALVVVVALVAEVVAGVTLEGIQAIFPLFSEVIHGIVLAAILWSAGDLTILLIDVGHDVRAARVLLGRLSARQAAEQSGGDLPG